MAKQIFIKGIFLALQAKEGTDKVKYRDLSKIDLINSEDQTAKDMISRIDQDYNNPVEYLQKEVDSIIRAMIRKSSLKKLLEDMDSAITPVIVLIDERMKRFNLWDCL